MKSKLEVEFNEFSSMSHRRLLSKEADSALSEFQGAFILQENTPGELNEPHWDTIEVYDSGSATYDLIKYLLK